MMFSTFPVLESNDVSRLFRTMLRPSQAPARPAFQPAVDVREQEGKVVLTADLPGVDPEAVKLTVEDGVLVLAGTRPERGDFERRFALSKDVDPAKIEAAYAHGVLTVTLPKRAEAQPRTIQIKR
jgi:HSP20 family protein